MDEREKLSKRIPQQEVGSIIQAQAPFYFTESFLREIYNDPRRRKKAAEFNFPTPKYISYYLLYLYFRLQFQQIEVKKIS